MKKWQKKLSPEHREFVFPAGQRLDNFLFQVLGDKYSRNKLQSFIEQGRVSIGDKTILKKAHQVHRPTPIQINLPAEKNVELIAQDFGIPILYQDKNLAVIHKPAGMTVHPGAGTGDDTLVHSLLAQLKTLSTGSEPDRPGIVHRLDRETEGIMVIARDDLTHARLADAFKRRKVQKKYKAWVWHRLKVADASLSGFIGRHPKKRKQMLFSKNLETAGIAAKEARLTYQSLSAEKYCTLVDIKLITGRTHQIRAAFDSLGNPVVGDQIYGRQQRKFAALPATIQEDFRKRGMLLMAYSLDFEHPHTGKLLSFSLPLSPRFDLASV